MITEGRIRELILLGNENRNLDYKGAFSWTDATNDARCEIVKDILAFANTRDGGVILIGVHDKTGAIVGLAESEWESFDQTKFNDFIHKYTNPRHTSRVHRMKVDGLRLVVIDIPEFAEMPILCAKEVHSSSNSSKQILRRGALYKRTDKATSEAIEDADEMRELLNRGLLRRQDELLKAFQQILHPRESVPAAPSTEFEAEVSRAEEAFSQLVTEHDGASLAELPHWTIQVRPQDYVPERITSSGEIQRRVQESAISLRGWTFPIAGHLNGAPWTNFPGGSQSFYAGGSHRPEALRVYKSALVVWWSGVGEDFWQASAGQDVISFISLIYSVTEWMLFAQRFFEGILAIDEQVDIRVSAYGIKDRRLTSLDPRVAFYEIYHIDVPEFEIGETISVSDLRADPEAAARRIIRRIFELFDWNDPAENMLAMWQQRLIQRQF